MGLFAIRNMLTNKEFTPYKRLAYNYLRSEKEWLHQRNLFNTKWYSEKYADILDTKHFKGNPIMHYLHYKSVLILDPNQLFDSAYYYTYNDDVVRLGMEPLRHFIGCSPFENRNPSLYFDLQTYMVQHPETAQANVNSLVYHLHTGYKEWVNTKWAAKNDEAK